MYYHVFHISIYLFIFIIIFAWGPAPASRNLLSAVPPPPPQRTKQLPNPVQINKTSNNSENSWTVTHCTHSTQRTIPSVAERARHRHARLNIFQNTYTRREGKRMHVIGLESKLCIFLHKKMELAEIHLTHTNLMVHCGCHNRWKIHQCVILRVDFLNSAFTVKREVDWRTIPR